MGMGLENPADLELLAADIVNGLVGRCVARTAGFGVVIEHRINDGAGATVALVHDIGDGPGGRVEDAVDLRGEAWSVHGDFLSVKF